MSEGAVVLNMQTNRMRRWFHMHQCVGALSIEVSTGMRHSQGSVLKLVQTTYGIKARTKKAALAELRALVEEEFPSSK